MDLYLRRVMCRLIRSIFFLLEAEKAHYLAMDLLRLACRLPLLRKALQKRYPIHAVGLERTVFGLRFPNPVGLGAGFDKNARWLNELATLGFGFVEIGTVTPLPQAGNDKPRLFRLPADRALINRMGFNNEGVEAVALRLRAWRQKHPVGAAGAMLIGGNIGKNKITPNEDAWKDYEICFLALFDVVDYFVVNVSSPNTPGLRALQEKESLAKILSNLQRINAARPEKKPLLLKIAPDLTTEQLDDILELALEIGLDGLVATNTTLAREPLSNESLRQVNKIGAGGLSGAPLRQRSTEIVRYISRQTEGKIPVIASGGIFTAADAIEKLEAGAALIQLWTGFIYEGPAAASNICKGLSGQETGSPSST